MPWRGRRAPSVPETAGLQRQSPQVVHAEAVESDGEVTAESLAIEVVAGDEVVARRLKVDRGEGAAGTEMHHSGSGNAAGDEKKNNYISSTHVLVSSSPRMYGLA